MLNSAQANRAMPIVQFLLAHCEREFIGTLISLSLGMISNRQLSTFLGVSRSTLYRRRKAGVLRGRKSSGRIFYRPEDVRRYLKNSYRKPRMSIHFPGGQTINL